MANYGVLTTNKLSMITGLDKSITGSSDRAIVLGDVPNIAVYVLQQYLNRSTPYQYAQFVGIPSILPETVNSCITINNVALYLSHIEWSYNDSGTGTKSDPIRTIKAIANRFILIYAAEQRITGQPSGFSTPISATLTVDSSTYTGIITKSPSTLLTKSPSTFGGNIYRIDFRGLASTHGEHVTGYVDIVNSFNIPVSTGWVERAYVTYYTPDPPHVIIDSEYFYEMQDFCGASSEQMFYTDHNTYRAATLASERYFFPHSMERNNDNELVNIEGNHPEPHENATKVILYRYTAARINGVAIADSARGLTAEQAQKADGKFFTTDSNLGASDGTNLQNTANGWYIKSAAIIWREMDYGVGLEVEVEPGIKKIKCRRYFLITYNFTNGNHYADVLYSYAKRVYIYDVKSKTYVESKTECT